MASGALGSNPRAAHHIFVSSPRILIKHVRVHDILESLRRQAPLADFSCGVASNDYPRRYVLHDNGSCSNHSPSADLHPWTDERIGTDPSVVVDGNRGLLQGHGRIKEIMCSCTEVRTLRYGYTLTDSHKTEIVDQNIKPHGRPVTELKVPGDHDANAGVNMDVSANSSMEHAK